MILDFLSAGVVIPFLTAPPAKTPTNTPSRGSLLVSGSAGVSGSANTALEQQQQRMAESVSLSLEDDPIITTMEEATSHWVKDTIVLCPTSEGELLPMNTEYPVDIFTSCLTTPIQMALQWFVRNNRIRMGVLFEDKHGNGGLDISVDSIPGQANDRKTPLGELNWIFTSVTDSIACNGRFKSFIYYVVLCCVTLHLIVPNTNLHHRFLLLPASLLSFVFDNEFIFSCFCMSVTICETAVTFFVCLPAVLPKPLFRQLFRQDLLVASMFRNLLLADKILLSLNCTPQSYPPLPPGVTDHPLWKAWDLACETCLFGLIKYGILGGGKQNNKNSKINGNNNSSNTKSSPHHVGVSNNKNTQDRKVMVLRKGTATTSATTTRYKKSITDQVYLIAAAIVQ